MKVVELDAYRVLYKSDDPTRPSLVFVTTKTVEAFVAYPRSLQATEAQHTETYAKFTLYPTTDPACGLARGNLEWMVTGIDSNKPNETQYLEIHSLNFNPGATVLLGDPHYEYPLLPGLRVKGKGIRFLRKPSSMFSVLGIRQPETHASRATQSASGSADSWHTVTDVPVIELLGDTKLIRVD